MAAIQSNLSIVVTQGSEPKLTTVSRFSTFSICMTNMFVYDGYL